LNVITILIDSLNRRFLEPYGGGFVKTPNMKRFAEGAVVFDNHFVGSTPCMPARRELMTGRREFLWRGWGPLEPFDRPIALEAKKAGAVTAMVTDHYHYWEYSAHGYLEHFDALKTIRGHEFDMWNTDPAPELPPWAAAIEKKRPGAGVRYYNNVKDFKEEEDFFSPKTFTEAADWLGKNHGHEKFFLWVENFDVHEPFHVPEPYRSMYAKNISEGYNCWPPYQSGIHGHDKEFWDGVSDGELDFIRAQYFGKVTMADKWLGVLMDKIDELDLWKDTAVILTTDHGHELGEKKRFGKQPPHYDLSANIPLMIRFPGQTNGFRTNALTTAADLYPTMCEMIGSDPTVSPHGRTLTPLIKGLAKSHRDAVVYGEYGSGATVTNDKYTYHSTWDKDAELNAYTAVMLHPQPQATSGKFIPGVDCPVWKYPQKSSPVLPELLFDRADDPNQLNDLSGVEKGKVSEMRRILKSLMDEEGAPPEQYIRLGL